MTIRTILRYPDPGLRLKCEAVTVFGPDLQALASDLLDTMRAAPGVGITAAHVGVSARLTIIELDPAKSALVYVNPEILSMSEETATFTEGSVSMPGVTEDVTRPKHIRFRYQDLGGNSHEETADGFLAICIQHEIDQLDGMFWLMRLSKLKRDRLIKKWEKQQK